MKGFLTAHDRIFRKTHDLDELASACEAVDPTLQEGLSHARDLTVFAWEFRYPGEAEAPSPKEARKFRAVAGEVISSHPGSSPPRGPSLSHLGKILQLIAHVILTFLAPREVLERFLADLRKEDLEVAEDPLVPGLAILGRLKPRNITSSRV